MICNCGRAIAANHRRPVVCRFCGSSTKPTPTTHPADQLRMLPLIEAQRFAICARCDRYDATAQTCGVLVGRNLPGRIWHPRGIPNGSARCPAGHWAEGYAGTLAPDDLDAVAVITTHFNPAGHAALSQTFAQWRPTLGPLPVRCLELSIDNAPREIPSSDLIHGGPQNLLWQKERLINLALWSLPDRVRYLAWLDHDLAFESPHWIRDSIDLLDQGRDAVQPFDSITYLDSAGRPIQRTAGGLYCLANNLPITAPGGAWVARVDWLRSIGGLFDLNIVGGGDSVFFSAVTRTENQYLDRQPPGLRSAALAWSAGVTGSRVAHLAGGLRHIWHGDRSARQYVSRDELLRAHNFDPSRDLEPDPVNNLHRWTAAAPPPLRAGVRDYFRRRGG